ncbi:MAG: MotA/TolQ/ExbB proton channel family protein [Saprospiraceae bacterium]|jgi:biopolymer transport protein ExbB|nr:MotA/TolQ/ExbB proton channel family protein [Saprospiraceae bacterium]MBL0024473.1 MotA/TolQ/ExbB proton channel family protein [Saprospiraceae bacterium]
MRKFLLLIGVFMIASYMGAFDIMAQAADTTAAAVSDTVAAGAAAASEMVDEASTALTQNADNAGAFQVLKEKFIEGDWVWMTPVLCCMIFGLAFCIERIITLNIASANTDTLLSKIEDKLSSGDLEGAKDVAKATPGPAASVIYEGLRNAASGPDGVEKAIVSYGSVQMSLMEKGLIWISLFIALAPMLGFLGTVIGMIQAFDKIQAAGDISPTVVAGGIKVALLTTVFGLIVAIILQIFYNYIVSKIDGITTKMEESSIALVETMLRNKTI